MRDEERRRSDKRTKRKGVARGFWLCFPPNHFLGLRFFQKGALLVEMNVIEAVQLVYLNLNLLRVPCYLHVLSPSMMSSLKRDHHSN
jgi:hypothetical protein